MNKDEILEKFPESFTPEMACLYWSVLASLLVIVQTGDLEKVNGCLNMISRVLQGEQDVLDHLQGQLPESLKNLWKVFRES